MFFKVFLELVGVGRFFHLDDSHGLSIVQAAAQTDLHCSLTFITSKHPHLNPCLAELLYTAFDIILEQVFDSCDAH